ncbi:MAG: hypothetical protein ACTHK8_03685 [Ginsengibacter sp.]
MREMEGGEEMSRSRWNRDGSVANPGMTRPEGTCPKEYTKTEEISPASVSHELTCNRI